MSLANVEQLFNVKLTTLQEQGIRKGNEKIIVGIKPGVGGFGPCYFLEGYGDRAFLRMNSNSYLGLSLHPQVIKAEAEAVEKFGTRDLEQSGLSAVPTSPIKAWRNGWPNFMAVNQRGFSAPLMPR